MELYQKLHYPASPESIKKVKLSLESFPEIGEKLYALGLDKEQAKSIFESWATYNALLIHSYSKSGFNAIDKIPNDHELNRIVDDQTWALTQQLKSIENYARDYGKEELGEIISAFGIYNFSRHKLKALHDQLERWKNGSKIETVVAEARADWNSFSDKLIKFEDESLEPGVFYFEVNTAVDLSRLAVRIGERERSFSREPDVRRFVVHAHGNPTKMLLGVNGEAIELQQYREAASGRGRLNRISKEQSETTGSKINERETNSYRRHLGPNFTVILQSCSTAGETHGKNIASTMAESHDIPVTGAKDTINSLIIKSDGSVEYNSVTGKVESATY
jgi:hypothetical protein